MDILQNFIDQFNIWAPVSGLIVGFVLGLIGSGGSVLAVPLLLYLVGISSPHVAIGTSSFAVALNAASGLINHHIKGNVKWRCAVVFTVAGVIGSFIGSTIGKSINGDILLIAFAMVMMIIAYFMLTNKKQNYNVNIRLTRDNAPILIPKLLGFGFIVGLSAGFFGIGGGFLIVPALIYALRLPIIYAIGTSLFAVTAFGLTTAFNYSLSGFVDWAIATQFILGGVIGSIIGTKLATSLANKRALLTQIFAVILILVALYMIVSKLISF